MRECDTLLVMSSVYDIAALEGFFRSRRVDAQQARRFRNALYKRFAEVEEVLAELPEGVRAEFADEFQFHALTLEHRRDSQQDGATKLIFRTASGHLIESVVLRFITGRTSLCISSQVGCAANCSFCATGKMGIARNLSVAEILDQVVQGGRLIREEHRRLRNVVLMGMGEPLHNETAVYGALDMLHDPRWLNHSPGRTLVSTVGIPEAMIRAARQFPQVNFALSLHSCRQEIRRKIIPLAEKYPLHKLRDAIRTMNDLQGRPVMIEYLMLGELTDTNDDLGLLVEFVRGLDVHLNLIPYNPIDDAPDLIATESPRIKEFSASLKSHGLTVTTRNSLGGDIAAACGQLVRQENRQLGARSQQSSDTLANLMAQKLH